MWVLVPVRSQAVVLMPILDGTAPLFYFGDDTLGVEEPAEVLAELVWCAGVLTGAELEVQKPFQLQGHPCQAPQRLATFVSQGVDQESAVQHEWWPVSVQPRPHRIHLIGLVEVEDLEGGRQPVTSSGAAGLIYGRGGVVESKHLVALPGKPERIASGAGPDVHEQGRCAKACRRPASETGRLSRYRRSQIAGVEGRPVRVGAARSGGRSRTC